MTEQRALKAAVRARAARTGEKYTAARRAVLENGAAPPAARAEFDRQVETLVARGYPELAGRSEAAFRAALEPLAAELPRDPAAGATAPFLIVVGSDLVPAEQAAERIERRGERPQTMFGPGELARYEPHGVRVPNHVAYLAVGVESVGETVGMTPEDATAAFEAAGRSPLTLEEGIALATHRPEAIAPNACFQMPGSRTRRPDGNGHDRRVASIWLSKGAPKVGWCWAGNPHTWLGSASCGRRIAPSL